MKATWTEDDCTCGLEGHEGWAEAYERLVGKPWFACEVLSREDCGDGDEIVMQNGVRIWSSFPGNSSITLPEGFRK